ncbi:thiamine phosphate synthase [Aquabacter sp. L1I39]|uniref:thiamine phosphate synthase n=1 Tax=Aquabacter sp. L1I39 TaxID=2820278 RepID=UPI001ADA0464|nr:thiamine phosphate synthase [Aquabacter sp. L1I39]QTL03839.1 thiamine phosphate synthase [Aquabacter sp. L1I39]
MTNTSPEDRARLMLVLPAALSPDDVASLVAAGDVAAVVAQTDTRSGANPLPNESRRLAALAGPVQAAGAALLLEGLPEMVAESGADGAHVRGQPAFQAAVKRLKPDFIAGAGGLTTRHSAMEAGEGGADYVLFGDAGLPFNETLELVRWWADLFEVPCVGVAETEDQAAALAQAGADFVALSGVWLLDREAAAMVARMDAAVAVAARAAQAVP